MDGAEIIQVGHYHSFKNHCGTTKFHLIYCFFFILDELINLKIKSRSTDYFYG